MKMRCGKAQEFLSQAMDELLPPNVIADLSRHLDDCGQCRQHRQDLALGRRLLDVTAPELPGNFDWRLQLRLNQTLQQAAGETAFPWHDPRSERVAWFRNFGTALSMGLAAVLALAIFFGPGQPPAGRHQTSPSSLAVIGSDRLPLVRNAGRSRLLTSPGTQHSVSAGGGLLTGVDSRFQLDRGWAGNDVEDLMTIQKLRLETRDLNYQILQYRRQIELMRAQLDRSDSNALDLGDR